MHSFIFNLQRLSPQILAAIRWVKFPTCQGSTTSTEWLKPLDGKGLLQIHSFQPSWKVSPIILPVTRGRGIGGAGGASGGGGTNICANKTVEIAKLGPNSEQKYFWQCGHSYTSLQNGAGCLWTGKELITQYDWATVRANGHTNFAAMYCFVLTVLPSNSVTHSESLWKSWATNRVNKQTYFKTQ